MSAPTERGLEFKVGLFVLLGLLFIAVMAVKFGQIGQGFKKFYPLTVELPNASGLIQNSDVQLAGARIGYVKERPQISQSASSVTVLLQIAEDIRIPRNTRFQVNSSGLLGDKFVEIVPDETFDPAKFDPKDPKQTWNAGDRVPGSKSGGLDLEALQKKAVDVFEKLEIEIMTLTEVTQKINEDVMGEANRKNIADTFNNLKLTTDRFAETSKSLDAVVKSTQGVVDTTKETMTNMNSAATDARKVLDSAHTLLGKAQSGEGPVATLLNNRELSENLKALVENLRERGILFYKDRAGKAPAASAPTPKRPAAPRSDRVRPGY